MDFKEELLENNDSGEKIYILDYDEDEFGKICFYFRKKISLKDLEGRGSVKEITNAVQLQRELYEKLW